MAENIPCSFRGQSLVLLTNLYMNWFPTAATVFCALALGLFGLFVMFPIGSAGIDTSVVLIYPLVAGAIIGAASPRVWAASGLVAWGGLILLVITPMNRTPGVGVFVIRSLGYIILAIMGGYIGHLGRKRISR